MATCQVVIDTIDDYVDIDIIIMLTMLMMMTIKVIFIRGRVDEAGQILEKAALMNNRTGVSKVWPPVSSWL